MPPEYSAIRSLPATHFVPDLMAHLNIKYYVGLLSAAEFHGAAHQRSQQFQVITEKQLRPIQCGKVTIKTFRNQKIDQIPVLLKKTTGTSIRVSTPEATAIDLIMYPKGSGGFSRIATVLSELSESINPELLANLSRSYASIRVVQRLGYLLDLVGAEELTVSLKKLLDEPRKSVRFIPLVPGISLKNAVVDSKWNLYVNEKIESDL